MTYFKETDNTYYYHGDHLGSMSWVTDGNGALIEHRQYMPYGEEWYHYKSTTGTYSERYQFTGKERDEESGYDYFGARYYDPTLLTSWMSVDPVVKYNESPYLYCGGNPMRNVDGDGRDWYQSEDGATCWSSSSDKSISMDGATYNNIGTTYSHTKGNATYDYNQNNLERITYSTNPTFYSQDPTKPDCKLMCDKMLGSIGVESTRAGEILMTTHDANGVVNGATANYQQGVNLLGENLIDGMPSIVGVDCKPQQQHNKAPHGDGMTDHFITIMGMTINVKTGETSYRFFDPGSKNGNKQKPTSMSSLIINQNGGFLTGETAGRGSKFTITTIRPSKHKLR